MGFPETGRGGLRRNLEPYHQSVLRSIGSPLLSMRALSRIFSTSGVRPVRGVIVGASAQTQLTSLTMQVAQQQ